jgi:hypothetical protein
MLWAVIWACTLCLLNVIVLHQFELTDSLLSFYKASQSANIMSRCRSNLFFKRDEPVIIIIGL